MLKNCYFASQLAVRSMEVLHRGGGECPRERIIIIVVVISNHFYCAHYKKNAPALQLYIIAKSRHNGHIIICSKCPPPPARPQARMSSNSV